MIDDFSTFRGGRRRRFTNTWDPAAVLQEGMLGGVTQQSGESLDLVVLGLYNPMFLGVALGNVIGPAIPYWDITETSSGSPATMELVADTAYPGGRKLKFQATTINDTMTLAGEGVPIQPFSYVAPSVVIGGVAGGSGTEIDVRFHLDLYREDGTLTRTVTAVRVLTVGDGTFGPAQTVFGVFQVAANERIAVPRLAVTDQAGSGTRPILYVGMLAFYDGVGDEQMGVLTELNFGATATSDYDIRIRRISAGKIGFETGVADIDMGFEIAGDPDQSLYFAMYLGGDSQFRVFLDAGAAIRLMLGPGNVAPTQVLTLRQTGWTAPTGTAQRGTFATDTVTLINLARAVKALIDDSTTHGFIGA